MDLTEDYRGALIFDVEAVAIDNAADFLEPVSAPSNYVKPDAIASYIQKATTEQLAKAALDIDLARIVALGLWAEGGEPMTVLCVTEDEEREALAAFWRGVAHPRPTLIGYNCCGYDLPLLMRRSLYLKVPAPRIAVSKYRHPDVVDLMLDLSYDGAQKYHSLAFYAARFGCDIVDDLTGADIASAFAEGRLHDIRAHNEADLRRTAFLAERLGHFRRRT